MMVAVIVRYLKSALVRAHGRKLIQQQNGNRHMPHGGLYFVGVT